MRIDVVTIFPEYLDPLGLSLIGRARERDVLDVRTWDLRQFTDDRHRSVDDAPYGGGAGMVMLPEPWGRALDTIADQGRDQPSAEPTIVFPAPSGQRFTQQVAAELSGSGWLVFACGRYEGIDERVWEYAHARHPGRVRTLSLGDYVLNGGEVAALAMIEAIARLVPEVIGNAGSLAEESHADGLLEYPVYTRPPSWRGYDVPAVLRSGDHAAGARWRREQQRQRTRARRPDLLAPSALADHHAPARGGPAQLPAELPAGLTVRAATPADAPELLVVQRGCWLEEGRINNTWDIPPLTEDLAQLRAGLADWTWWLVHDQGRLVGGVRARSRGLTWHIGRLMVTPDLRGRGLGRWLLAFAEEQADAQVSQFALMTGAASSRNLRLYRKAGYRPVPEQPEPGVVVLAKPRRGTPLAGPPWVQGKPT
ncbi:MAG: tRNA (guanosine(37)-N1)-methyltransferase TrmD [Austwickia sp.]|nr:tRNA (guanosine(37)-N1)-methyltransferase TrmD [Austwickia sp.]MBK8436978.1 tRNA (guanosine(37)-N1)-methyltransferase TrmD [Austwickia sp.]MBK9100605.1 tRNA (guanosine(37)-N1)-methyltransferase TrmD [Austwickia sp.]